MRIGILGMEQALRSAIVIAVAAAGLSAQTLTGTVKDAGSQAAIAGATVTLLSDPTINAISGADGAFSLNLPSSIRRDGRFGDAIGFSGSELTLSVSGPGARLAVDLFDLRGNQVRALHDAKVAAGTYAFPVTTAGLSAGLYVVRARVGSLVRSFKVSTANPAAGRIGLTAIPASSAPAARLAKSAAALEFLIVVKEGYLKKSHAVNELDKAQDVLLAVNAPATQNLKIFSDQAMPEIDWANSVIYAWEQTSTLLTDSTSSAGFGGSKTVMKISTAEGFTWNGWGFHMAKQDVSNTQPTADLSAYKGGSLHLAVKGTMPTLGIMMSSTNQGQGAAPLVDLATKGYLPDDQWHEITIPLADFDDAANPSLNLADMFVYLGFVAPNVNGATFDPLASYWVDDIYYIPAPK